MEQPTGFNEIAAGMLPPLLYFEGLSRYRMPGEIIQNDVYLVQLEINACESDCDFLDTKYIDL